MEKKHKNLAILKSYGSSLMVLEKESNDKLSVDRLLLEIRRSIASADYAKIKRSILVSSDSEM